MIYQNSLAESGEREKHLSSGATQSSRSLANGVNALIAAIKDEYRVCPRRQGVDKNRRVLLDKCYYLLVRYSTSWRTIRHPPSATATRSAFVGLYLNRSDESETLPLSMCFIDLQNAYGSVDRELRWEVLASFGVLSKLLSIFWNGVMRARERTDDGERIRYCNVTQRWRHGCALLPF